MHLLHSFTSLYRVPITCHVFFEPRGATDNPLAWWKARSGGEKTVHLEGGGVGDADLKPGERPPGWQFQWSPAPRSAVQPRMSSRNHLTGAASLHQWETRGQSSANNASLALEEKCSIWHLTCCILNICSWICLSSRKSELRKDKKHVSYFFGHVWQHAGS